MIRSFHSLVNYKQPRLVSSALSRTWRGGRLLAFGPQASISGREGSFHDPVPDTAKIVPDNLQITGQISPTSSEDKSVRWGGRPLVMIVVLYTRFALEGQIRRVTRPTALLESSSRPFMISGVYSHSCPDEICKRSNDEVISGVRIPTGRGCRRSSYWTFLYCASEVSGSWVGSAYQARI